MYHFISGYTAKVAGTKMASLNLKQLSPPALVDPFWQCTHMCMLRCWLQSSRCMEQMLGWSTQAGLVVIITLASAAS